MPIVSISKLHCNSIRTTSLSKWLILNYNLSFYSNLVIPEQRSSPRRWFTVPRSSTTFAETLHVDFDNKNDDANCLDNPWSEVNGIKWKYQLFFIHKGAFPTRSKYIFCWHEISHKHELLHTTWSGFLLTVTRVKSEIRRNFSHSIVSKQKIVKKTIRRLLDGWSQCCAGWVNNEYAHCDEARAWWKKGFEFGSRKHL